MIQPTITLNEETLRRCLKQNFSLKIYDIDGNGRAKWSLFHDDRIFDTIAYGHINLVNNWSHVTFCDDVNKIGDLSMIDSLESILEHLVEFRGYSQGFRIYNENYDTIKTI